MSRQLYHKGDLVQIADDLGPSMEHFEKGKRAIVIGSYRDQYGGGRDQCHSYTLFIEGRGQVSWYYESQLTLIAHAQHDLLARWEDEADQRHAQAVDLRWIVSHLKADPANARTIPASSILKLFEQVGFQSRFPRTGEYYHLELEWQQALPFFMQFIQADSPDDLPLKAGTTEEERANVRRLWEKLHGKEPS